MGKAPKTSTVKHLAEPKRRHNGKSPPDPVDLVKAAKASKPKPLCLDKKFQKVEKKPKSAKQAIPKDGNVKATVETSNKTVPATSRPSALRKSAGSTTKEAKIDQSKGKKALEDLKDKLEKMKALEEADASEEEKSDGEVSEFLDSELQKLLDPKSAKIPKDSEEEEDDDDEDCESESDDASNDGSGDDNEDDESSDGEESDMDGANDEEVGTTANAATAAQDQATSNALVPHEEHGQRNSNVFCNQPQPLKFSWTFCHQ